ncbi:hypothetical protein FQA39_LY14305 [Lamprigera yunnana]|nr:hypothetical protein FQA39_LY14305 [Lamprigera yunnana]
MRHVGATSGSSLRGPPGLGFKLTSENDYDIDNRRLTNVMDPANSSNVLDLKYYLSSGSRLLEVGIPSSKTDAIYKSYVDSTIRDSETTMRTHYTAYFDNTNAEMGIIIEKINSVHYTVEGDINGIIANIIPSMVKTMVLELVRENVDSIPTSCVQLAKEQIIKYSDPKYNINDLKTGDCETLLLNQTIYYLNKSKSKWISVGLYYPFEFASVVKIFGRSKQYVIFKEEEWIQFHEQRENINKYFQTFDTMWKPRQIGSKTLTFEMIEEKKILKIEDMSGNEVYLDID